jgi:hypothetical protein
VFASFIDSTQPALLWKSSDITPISPRSKLPAWQLMK